MIKGYVVVNPALQIDYLVLFVVDVKMLCCGSLVDNIRIGTYGSITVTPVDLRGSTSTGFW